MPTLTTLPEPEVQRRWKKWSSESNGDGGDPYTGYDRFGRWVHMRWFKEDTTPVPLVNVKWGYNRASLKTWRQDVLATSLSAAQDQYFTYDGLYQVNGRQLGVLNGSFSGITGTPVQAEDFTYDETGNWVTYEQTKGGILDMDQSREHNTSNQITEIDELSSGVAYDANGNMIKIPTGGAALDGSPRKMIWDAWNRLRKVTDNADNVLATYEYDAKTRRTVSITATTRHTYYNDQWRSVEERLGSSTSAERQQVWHPKDRWDLLLRDRSTTNDGTFDERLYSLNDQLDPVTVCDASGEIQERYAYSAFGITAVLDKNFVQRTINESDFAWNWLFHGEFRDEVTDWYNYGYRYYVADLGRWVCRDPIREVGGLNLYTYTRNASVNYSDAYGLKTICIAQENKIVFSGGGWKLVDVSGGKSVSGNNQEFTFDGSARWEAEVTVECMCKCDQSQSDGPESISYETRSGLREFSATFDANMVSYNPSASGPAVPLPSGGNLMQQLMNALGALFGFGVGKVVPTPSYQPVPTGSARTLQDEAEIHAPHDPSQGNWKGGDPCGKN